MNRKDVISLFTAWKASGLRPPAASTPEQANQMIDAFYGQYKNVTTEEYTALKNKLSHLKYWPRFSDVDEVLAECRREKNGVPSYTGGLFGKEKRNKECEKILNGVPADKAWVMALAKKCARKFFPDAQEDFILENKLVLATQAELDFKCATCYGLTRKECPFGGHEPYLRVEPETGLCIQYVDSADCGKVFA